MKNYRLWFWTALMVANAMLMISHIKDRDWPFFLLGVGAILVCIREFSSRQKLRQGLTYASLIVWCISIVGTWMIR
ncbi:hypothetical protein [uncultured Alistipes sp.]|uniref:hypothetical protein n=1 Tax=uncultured Alistipes sp. TaxID=538949 RepID=UPI00260D4246|nr:hypothetical protein [uncultured Alistipes sp.]